MKYLNIFIILLFLSACSTKQKISSHSKIIIFKTPVLKFYDKGFITKYDDMIHLQVFEIGQIALDLKIYKDEVCQSTFECISSKEFNQKYLNSSYSDDFLYKLFLENNITFKDKENGILIKVK